MLRKQVTLKKGREPLQIPVPEGFEGGRSSEDENIFVYPGQTPVLLTLAEIALVEDYLESLSYSQELVFGAVMIGEDDPLIDASHDRLDQVELAASLPNSRIVPGSGERSPRERLLIIREAGYLGSDQPTLTAS